jgi:hypothetical protein
MTGGTRVSEREGEREVELGWLGLLGWIEPRVRPGWASLFLFFSFFGSVFFFFFFLFFLFSFIDFAY